MWQVFVDFKKAYDNIHQDNLYNIIYKFRIPSRFISLIKVQMNGTKYRVRVEQFDNVLFEKLQVVTGLKQDDVLLSLLFNIAQEKVVRKTHRDSYSIDIGSKKIGILGFANDLNIVGDDGKSTAQSTAALINEAKAV